MTDRLEMLLCQAELAIAAARRERDGKRSAALRRLLRTALLLTSKRTLNDQLRKSFVEAFAESAYGDVAVNEDEALKNVVVIDGSFDMMELAKRIIW